MHVFGLRVLYQFLLFFTILCVLAICKFTLTLLTKYHYLFTNWFHSTCLSFLEHIEFRFGLTASNQGASGDVSCDKDV